MKTELLRLLKDTLKITVFFTLLIYALSVYFVSDEKRFCAAEWPAAQEYFK
ncbi:MAG: hypothetical protein LBU87_03695 [Lactobacillales bacterium]|jgi:hypothetical protein|nr:hypothetical protein [Lactobacillales bacterium]